MKQIKIIPLVLIVVVISFSVRVIDLVSDMPVFSGSVQAEETESESDDVTTDPVAADTADAAQAGGEMQAGSEADGPSDPETKDTVNTSKEGDSRVWRNPTGEDPRFDQVRRDVFKDLTERRRAIEEKERKLAAREALVQAAEKEVDQKVAEMNRLREKLEDLLEQQTEKERQQIDRLVTIYEGMKAKDAARIFDSLDLDVLAEVPLKCPRESYRLYWRQCLRIVRKL